MPEPSDKYKPSEADLDLVLEQATGKPVDPVSLAAGISSLQHRIARLDTEKAKLLDRMEAGFDATLKGHLATIDKELANADRHRT